MHIPLCRDGRYNISLKLRYKLYFVIHIYKRVSDMRMDPRIPRVAGTLRPHYIMEENNSHGLPWSVPSNSERAHKGSSSCFCLMSLTCVNRNKTRKIFLCLSVFLYFHIYAIALGIQPWINSPVLTRLESPLGIRLRKLGSKVSPFNHYFTSSML